MTAFDHFQTATCLIAEGDRPAARRALVRALLAIHRTGEDRHMRGDLAALLQRIRQ